MKIKLIRHTKVDVPDGICYGQTDVKLASTFPEEKEEVKRKLNSNGFEKIYTSPLQRCLLLANDIADGALVDVDDRLAELNFGDWEGIAWDKIIDTTKGEKWYTEYIHTTCPNGESFDDLINRIHSFINEVRNEKSICIIITHGGPIRAFLSIINTISPRDTFKINIEYGQIIDIEF